MTGSLAAQRYMRRTFGLEEADSLVDESFKTAAVIKRLGEMDGRRSSRAAASAQSPAWTQNAQCCCPQVSQCFMISFTVQERFCRNWPHRSSIISYNLKPPPICTLPWPLLVHHQSPPQKQIRHQRQRHSHWLI